MLNNRSQGSLVPDDDGQAGTYVERHLVGAVPAQILAEIACAAVKRVTVPDKAVVGVNVTDEVVGRCERMKQGECSSKLCELLAKVTERYNFHLFTHNRVKTILFSHMNYIASSG